MNYLIFKKLKKLQKKYKKIESSLSDPNIISNQILFRDLSKQYIKLLEIKNCFKQYLKIKKEIVSTKNLLLDEEIKDIAQEEIVSLNKSKINLEKKLKLMLVSKDPEDKYGCFLEIRAATGGNEAALFAADLFRMYVKFAENHHWKVDTINVSNGECGGFKEIITKISHEGAYGLFKFESGGHRVQRIPTTESQGRIHTSTCTVAVMPEIPIRELPKINSNDIRIDTFRSSGAGGQHVNTTDSAIRITHLPTGIVVECQDERSQHKNKAKAMLILGSHIRSAEIERRKKKQSEVRRTLLGSGDRSDRIRTYNFPQGRVTDHRIGLTVYKLEEIIGGKLDSIIQPIINKYQTK